VSDMIRLALLLILLGSQAFAQVPLRNCAERDRVVMRLAERYGEERRSVGLANGNRVMEVYANLETRSWTITVTDTRGMTCVLAAGGSYDEVEERLPANL